jgi:uncharacterized protein
MYKCAYHYQMRYQWDRNKALTNLNKHDIDFTDTVSVFSARKASKNERLQYEEE